MIGWSGVSVDTPDQPINTDRRTTKASFLQDSAADRHQHRKLEAVCTAKGLLMMSA
jgi:hypothetical protein